MRRRRVPAQASIDTWYCKQGGNEAESLVHSVAERGPLDPLCLGTRLPLSLLYSDTLSIHCQALPFEDQSSSQISVARARTTRAVNCPFSANHGVLTAHLALGRSLGVIAREPLALDSLPQVPSSRVGLPKPLSCVCFLRLEKTETKKWHVRIATQPEETDSPSIRRLLLRLCFSLCHRTACFTPGVQEAYMLQHEPC